MPTPTPTPTVDTPAYTYWLRQVDFLYRRSSDAPTIHPNETLGVNGWGERQPGAITPFELPELSLLTIDEAKEWASKLGLPTTGW